MPAFRDLTKEPPFDRLTVIALADREPNGRTRWLCQCTCGTMKVILAHDLTRGMTRSCGCLRKEFWRQRMTTHGLSDTPVNRIHRHMIQRCTNPKLKSWKHYGGRGITVCQRWRTFEAFYADVGERPSPQHSIDRIDNNGHYSCGRCEECLANGWPANWRWATRIEQNNNKRDNTPITFNGVTRTIAQWERHLNYPYRLLDNRFRHGWTIEEAFTIPPEGPWTRQHWHQNHPQQMILTY